MKNKIIVISVIAIVIVIVGILISKNKQQTKYNYEIPQITQYNYFIYKDNEKYGVIDKSGNVVIEAKYESVTIPNPERDIFICNDGNQTEVLNSTKNALFTEYELVEPIKLKTVSTANPYEKSTLVYKKDGLYGLIDYNGKIITKNIYEKIENLQPTEGKFIVSKGGKYGAIDLKGNILVNIDYNNVISDGYYTKEEGYKKSGFIVSTKTSDGVKYGYISYNGKELLADRYNEINRISKEDKKNVYLIASENGKFRTISKHKKSYRK